MKPSTRFNPASGALFGLVFAAVVSVGAAYGSAGGAVDAPEFKQALAAYAEERLEDAQTLLEKLARRFPDDPKVLNNLAVIAAKQGDTDRAIKLFKRAIATDAAINTGYHNLSAIYAHLASLSYRDALSLELAEPHTPELNLVGVPDDAEAADAKSDVALEASARAARAKETATPLVRDPQAPVRSEHERDVVTAVRRWAQTWARQDLEAYFASYVRHYTPPGGSHRAWKKLRRERVTAPRRIEIQLSDVRVNMRGRTEAKVTFRQKYQSNRLSSSVIKQLQMRKVGDGWKIALEQVL